MSRITTILIVLGLVLATGISAQAQYADGDGLYAQNNSAPSLYECQIETNGSDGIECKGNNSFLIASNSKIRANADHGIYLFQADADGLYAGIDF